MQISDSGENWRDMYFTTLDGLRIYARHYPAVGASGRRPLLCLAGLTRNANDFHDIATALSTHPETPRDIYCIDTRGRGRSDFDPNWDNYVPFMELVDVMEFLTIMGLEKVGILGTSRGGILAMLLAAIRPTAIGTVILNDIGPEIEKTGLARIRGYVGRLPVPVDWEEAAFVVQTLNKGTFVNLEGDDWMKFARQVFLEDEDGLPGPSYDDNISNSISSIDITQDIPSFWHQFEALSRVPVMLIRGQHSDILTDKTAKEMARRHARLEYFVAKNEGHAPLLWDKVSQRKISEFLARTDTKLQTVVHDGRKNIFVAA